MPRAFKSRITAEAGVTAAGLTLSSTTSPIILNASAGTAGQVLTSAGAGATPTWTTVSGGGSGTVTSVAMTVPTGLSISGSPITTSGTLALTLTSGYSIPTTSSQSNWDTAFTDRNKWDGGSTGLTASTGRTSLGATTVGSNVFTLTNPSAISWLRVNADNTVTARSATDTRTDLGLGTMATETASNYVALTGNQTIAGTKTFSSSIDTPGISRTGNFPITISTVNSAGNGADISINGGTSSGNGGNIVITAGNSGSFTGGNVTINAGDGNTDGNIYIGTTSGTQQFLYLGTSSSYTIMPGALDIGGGAGVGASGVTISATGNIDADGALTVGGGYGSSGVTISSVGAISADSNIVVGGNGTFGNLVGTGTRNVNSTAAGVLTNSTSSMRYKQDIVDAEYVYDDILRLQPKTFKLKSEVEELENPVTYAGFIAEDVDEIDSLKVFVGYAKTPDGDLIPDSLYYAEMVSALVSAIKHQDSRIKALEAQVQALSE